MEPRTILFVDDDADIRTIAGMALQLVGGWQVELAASGAEALARCSAARPDLVILDVMMPGLDGPQTLTRMRADPTLAHIPVIFMTAKIQSADVDGYLGQGVVGVIGKPFDPMALPDRIRALLADHGEGRR